MRRITLKDSNPEIVRNVLVPASKFMNKILETEFFLVPKVEKGFSLWDDLTNNITVVNSIEWLVRDNDTETELIKHLIGSLYVNYGKHNDFQHMFNLGLLLNKNQILDFDSIINLGEQLHTSDSLFKYRKEIDAFHNGEMSTTEYLEFGLTEMGVGENDVQLKDMTFNDHQGDVVILKKHSKYNK